MGRARFMVIVIVAGLLVLTVLAVLGANLGLFGKAAQESELAKWGPAGVLGEVVYLFSLLGKTVFARARISMLMAAPAELPNLDVSRVEWDEEHCKMRTLIAGKEGREVPVRMAPSRGGDTVRVIVPPEMIEDLGQDDYIELRLQDVKGNPWRIPRFSHLEQLVYLTFRPADKAKIIQDWGESV